MPEWQRLRNQHPEMFEGPQRFEVFAQPAAVVYGIIQAWQLEDLAKLFPGGLLQRDMLGSYRSAQSQAMMKFLNFVDAPIVGKMTPCLQLTDTDCARKLKVLAEVEKETLRQELKLKAMMERTPEKLVMKPPEIWRICSRTAISSLKKVYASFDGNPLVFSHLAF